MAEPLLTLETLVPDRPFIKIDGQPYDLALPDDFGLIQAARMTRLLSRVRETEAKVEQVKADGEVDQAVVDQLERIIDDQLGLILYAPPEIRAKLSDKQKLEIIAAFTPAVEGMTRKPPRQSKAPSTSGSSSVNSRRRTARRSGSRCPSAS